MISGLEIIPDPRIAHIKFLYRSYYKEQANAKSIANILRYQGFDEAFIAEKLKVPERFNNAQRPKN